MDGEQQLEEFAEQPVVLLEPGEYTLRIEEVEITEDRLTIIPFCVVVGGPSDGKKACPESYDFHEGGDNADAIRNLYGWGVSREELAGTDGDVKSIGALLEGRLGTGYAAAAQGRRRRDDQHARAGRDHPSRAVAGTRR